MLCDECLRFDAGYVFALHLRGLCSLASRCSVEAIADLEQAAALTGRAPFYLGLLGLCYGEFGMREEALGLVAELDGCARNTYVPPQCYVFIYAGLGEREQALATRRGVRGRRLALQLPDAQRPRALRAGSAPPESVSSRCGWSCNPPESRAIPGRC